MVIATIKKKKTVTSVGCWQRYRITETLSAAGLSVSSAQSLSHVPLFATPWTAARRLPCPSPTPEACSTSCQ